MVSSSAAKELVRKIAYNTKLPYFSITPTFSICRDDGYIVGEVSICPTCGKQTEVYSRVVGYFRPVRNWNDGKRMEYKDRLTYNEKKAANGNWRYDPMKAGQEKQNYESKIKQ